MPHLLGPTLGIQQNTITMIEYIKENIAPIVIIPIISRKLTADIDIITEITIMTNEPKVHAPDLPAS